MMRHTVMLLVLATAVVGCEEIPVPIAVSCPSEADYVDYVSPVLEKRCGTLDCHGQLGRPLKFYSQNGLRLFTEDEFNDPALARDAGTGNAPRPQGDGVA